MNREYRHVPFQSAGTRRVRYVGVEKLPVREYVAEGLDMDERDEDRIQVLQVVKLIRLKRGERANPRWDEKEGRYYVEIVKERTGLKCDTGVVE